MLKAFSSHINICVSGHLRGQ